MPDRYRRDLDERHSGPSGSAEHIKLRVNEEFDRVAASLKSIADSQNGDHRADTEAMINILEEKRAEVMSRNQAGYFLNNWQEISDQVRRIVYEDARCVAIQSKDAA